VGCPRTHCGFALGNVVLERSSGAFMRVIAEARLITPKLSEGPDARIGSYHCPRPSRRLCILRLLCAEHSVSGVAQSRHDVTVII
jgi:hypothetical protein